MDKSFNIFWMMEDLCCVVLSVEAHEDIIS